MIFLDFFSASRLLTMKKLSNASTTLNCITLPMLFLSSDILTRDLYFSLISLICSSEGNYCSMSVIMLSDASYASAYLDLASPLCFLISFAFALSRVRAIPLSFFLKRTYAFIMLPFLYSFYFPFALISANVNRPLIPPNDLTIWPYSFWSTTTPTILSPFWASLYDW